MSVKASDDPNKEDHQFVITGQPIQPEIFRVVDEDEVVVKEQEEQMVTIPMKQYDDLMRVNDAAYLAMMTAYVIMDHNSFLHRSNSPMAFLWTPT
jgi:hypothetical protein